MVHPNSLMFNAYPIFWPSKLYWFSKKFLQILFIRDFPAVPENHVDAKISRSYFPVPKFLKH